MECYLDNAATTRTAKEVADEVMKMMTIDFGNPSSLHTKGFEAEQYVKAARKTIADTLSVKDSEILFTSGGTESNNMALIGTALAKKRMGKHIITTSFEHASVTSPLLFLEENGYEISFCPVDAMGHVKEDKLLDMVRPDTILVSIMYVNNEVGAVQDIKRLSRLVKEKNPDITFHSDCIQSYGKYVIKPKEEGIDLLSVSGHKINGPKGTGFLYIKSGSKIKPIIYGGGQQKGMRSGTDNVPGIVGLAKAAQLVYENNSEKVAKMYEIKEHFAKRLTSEIEGASVNCVPQDIRECAPHVLSVSIEGVRAEVLLHSLEEKEVYVSSGSACSSNHPGTSGTLVAIGLDKKLLDSTVRFSFSFQTTMEEVDYAVEAVKEIVPKLRRHVRR